MAFQVSPGVQIREFDLTAIVPAVSSTPAAYVGLFQWGPADQVVLVNTEKQLETIFYRPHTDAHYATSWLMASNFLSYGGNLQVVRYVQDVTDYDLTLIDNTNGLVDRSKVEEIADLNAVSVPLYPTSRAVNNTDTLITVKNREHFESLTIGGASAAFDNAFCARFPGSIANSLGVVVFAPSSTANTATLYQALVNTADASVNWIADVYSLFTSFPLTTQDAADKGFSRDEIHVAIIDLEGKFGTKNQVLEIYNGVSVASDAKNPDGTTNYWVNVINNKSQYVYVADFATQLVTSGTGLDWGSAFANSTPGAFKTIPNRDNTNATSELYSPVTAFKMQGGSVATSTGSIAQNGSITETAYSASNPTLSANIVTQYENSFGDPDLTDVSIIIGFNTTIAADLNDLIAVAENRKDAICFVSACYDTDYIGGSRLDILDQIKDFADAMTSTSYGVLDSGYKYQYDRFNNVYRYIPLCADTAGCAVRTDNQRDPWWSPAGYDRGRILNVVKLVFNPNQSERDELYKKNVNPIITSQGFGVILFGDKTLQKKPSAFDRINVRRLFNVLEKSIATAAKFQLFEFNDPFTRSQFKQLVEPFLREIQGKRGISTYAVVCDESNNTPTVIDSNRFVADIFVAPNRSINFIQLNFIATPTGVAFAEYGG